MLTARQRPGRGLVERLGDPGLDRDEPLGERRPGIVVGLVPGGPVPARAGTVPARAGTVPAIIVRASAHRASVTHTIRRPFSPGASG